MAAKLILFVLVFVLAAYSNSYKIKRFPKVWKMETADSSDLTLQTDPRGLIKTIDTPGAWKVLPGSVADFNANERLDVDVRVPYHWDVNLSSVSYSVKNSVSMFTFLLHGRTCAYINMKYSNLAGQGSYASIILKLDKMVPVTGYVSNETFGYMFTVRKVTSADHACHGPEAYWFVRTG